MFKSFKKFLPRLWHLSLGQTLSDITASGLTIRPDRYIHDPQSCAFLRNTVDATACAEANKKSAMTNSSRLESRSFVQLLSTPPFALIP
jgi:hypothetical protein